MKYLKMLGLAAVAAMALMAVVAGPASATTLEKTGAKQSASVTLSASLEPSTSALLALTDGSLANTCSVSSVGGSNTSITSEGSKPLSGPISVLSFENCTRSPVVVDVKGSLSVEWLTGTTNGTIKSFNAEVTVPSPIGTLSCKTGTGAHLGKITGKSGSVVSDTFATMDIEATLNCGFLAPSAAWTATYLVTSPHGFGVIE